ncbi:MAG: GntP family transporter [Corynebacterium sp.]|nr:GntP family transporter [Corynebacterium sp.]
MSVTSLLLIAAVAVAVLLFLVIRVRLSAFVALLLVSLGTALATGIPIGELMPTITEGMAKTLGSVAIVVGLGAMLGRLIEESGGATGLATYFTDKLGAKRVVGAVSAAAFVLGIPVFFDVAFIIVAPIVLGFARVASVSPIKIGLPVAAMLMTTHVALPPHPGPVAAAEILGIDPGFLILVGTPISILTALVGYFACKRMPLDRISLEPLPFDAPDEISSASDRPNAARRIHPIVFLVLILLPIAQIMVGTVGMMNLSKEDPNYGIFSFLGSSALALLVAVMIAYLLLGHRAGWDLARRGSIMDSALPTVAVIVFVTGAGGVFANVLVKSGIGVALADSLAATSIPLILMAFLISVALRVSQGSATVAILTSAGLMASPLAAADYSTTQIALVTLAICFGAFTFSHINDSGFWIVTKYLGLSVKDGLKTWTVYSTVFGLIGFLASAGAFAMIS